MLSPSQTLWSCPRASALGHDHSGSATRLGILASGEGSNFEAIARAFVGVSHVEVSCLVCNQPEAGALGRAERLGIPYECVPHQGFEERALFDDAVAQALIAHDVQWVIMAGWMRLMGAGFLDAFSGRVLNIHPSLLPSFKGMRALERAWEAGQKIVGCSVHWVVPQMDAGALIAQAAMSVEPHWSFQQVRKHMSTLEHSLYPQAILAVLGQSAPKQPDLELKVDSSNR